MRPYLNTAYLRCQPQYSSADTEPCRLQVRWAWCFGVSGYIMQRHKIRFIAVGLWPNSFWRFHLDKWPWLGCSSLKLGKGLPKYRVHNKCHRDGTAPDLKLLPNVQLPNIVLWLRKYRLFCIDIFLGSRHLGHRNMKSGVYIYVQCVNTQVGTINVTLNHLVTHLLTFLSHTRSCHIYSSRSYDWVPPIFIRLS